jgi:D-alanyl-lipoteichoic acid acyltransferase DltB (MBOAT superfamily)
VTFVHFPQLFTGVIELSEWLGISEFRNPLWNWIKPLGLSFYTLTCIAYIIDVFRDPINYVGHPGKVASSILYFPKLIAGPWETVSSFIQKIELSEGFDMRNIRKAYVYIFVGWLKVWLLVPPMYSLVQFVFRNPASHDGFVVLFACIMAALHFYMVFSGAMNLGRGVSELLGIPLRENFDSPLISSSPKQLWSKFNVTLMEWVNAYVLKESIQEIGNVKAAVLVLLQFVCVSSWYGSGLPMLYWGGANGLLVLAYNLKRSQLSRLHTEKPILNGFLTFFFFSLTFVFLHSYSLVGAFMILERFFEWNLPGLLSGSFYDLGWSVVSVFSIPLLSLGIVLVEWISKDKNGWAWWDNRSTTLRWIVYVFMLLVFLLYRMDKEFVSSVFSSF